MSAAWPPAFPAGADRLGLRGGRLLSALGGGPAASCGTVAADLLIEHGRIARIAEPGALAGTDAPAVELDGGLVLPAFVDVHTHLDKAFIGPRAPNADGGFDGAVAAAAADREANWSAADVRRRMQSALRTAYAHGTAAIRTHLDSIGPQTAVTWPIFEALRDEWRGRVALQAVALFPIETALDAAEFGAIVRTVRNAGGVLGGFTYATPRLTEALDRIFRAAGDHGLDLDLHVDETGDPAARALRMVAETALRHRFPGKILAGHCCSLALQPPDEADRTMDLVAAAGIAVATLPMCNMFLQDRTAGRTPRWRGVAPLHELKARGIAVMAASDNVRDPFYAYGDFDMLEVFREAVRIAHLDAPFADWPRMVTATPATHMRLDGVGTIAEGGAADLVLCRARSLPELLSRPQGDRIVVRAGKPIDGTPPDPRALDDLMEAG